LKWAIYKKKNMIQNFSINLQNKNITFDLMVAFSFQNQNKVCTNDAYENGSENENSGKDLENDFCEKGSDMDAN